MFTSIGLIGEDPAAGLTAATAAFTAGDIAGADAAADAVAAQMTGAADAGRTRAIVGGLGGAALLGLGAGGAVAVYRRRRVSAVEEPQPFFFAAEAAPAPVAGDRFARRAVERARSVRYTRRPTAARADRGRTGRAGPR